MITIRFQLLILISILAVCALCVFASTAHASELSSTNYTLTTEGFGNMDRSVLSSENFSVVIKNQSYTYGTSSDDGDGDGDEGEDNDEDDGEGTQTGSRRTRVDRRINSDTLPEIIVGSKRENQNVQKNSVLPILRDKVLEEVPMPDMVESDVLNELNHSRRFSDMNLSASAIGAWMNGYFQDVFAERGARASLLIGVLLFLFVVRTYTKIGRKYSPF